MMNALHINVQLTLFRYLTTLWEHAVAQLVEALRCRTVGRGFDSRWCQWNFSLTQSFLPHCSDGVYSASNINDYHEYLLGVKEAGA